MEEHDQQFENFLREFKPRRPRALPETGIAAPGSWHRLAAAAALTIAIGGSVWLASRKATQSHLENLGSDDPQIAQGNARGASQRLELFPLTRLALTNPERLDATLTEASRTVLPDLRGNNSTLRVLAKE